MKNKRIQVMLKHLEGILRKLKRSWHKKKLLEQTLGEVKVIDVIEMSGGEWKKKARRKKSRAEL